MDFYDEWRYRTNKCISSGLNFFSTMINIGFIGLFVLLILFVWYNLFYI